MAGIRISRRTGVVWAAGALTALMLAACSTTDSPNASNTTPPGGTLGEVPSATATATPTANPTSTGNGNGDGGGGGGTNTPTYPKAAKDYGLAFMNAYSSKNYDRLNQLGEQAAVQQVKDNINYSGGAPNGQWSLYSCGSESNDQTGCTYRNAHGDDARVIMKNTQLGFPTAVTSANLERTTYPSDPVSYVNLVLEAKGNGNKQRVLRLANSTVWNKLTCNLSGTIANVNPIDSTYVKVSYQVYNEVREYSFKVLANPGGKTNAVKDVLSITC